VDNKCPIYVIECLKLTSGECKEYLGSLI